jgi:hypothetical protein
MTTPKFMQVGALTMKPSFLASRNVGVAVPFFREAPKFLEILALSFYIHWGLFEKLQLFTRE